MEKEAPAPGKELLETAARLGAGAPGSGSSGERRAGGGDAWRRMRGGGLGAWALLGVRGMVVGAAEGARRRGR